MKNQITPLDVARTSNGAGSDEEYVQMAAPGNPLLYSVAEIFKTQAEKKVLTMEQRRLYNKALRDREHGR